MAQVKILLKGYLSADTGGRTCCTITLIQDENLNIIVDPGTISDPQILINKLQEADLKPNDINIVILTHSHVDHYRSIGLFPHAKALDLWGLWNKDFCEEYDRNLTKDIEIIETPGHSPDSITILVKIKEGKVAICGDVFWKKDFPPYDQYANDSEKLAESRQKILKLADYIIPGHGDIYKTNQNKTQ